jgi:hypothetical protein
VIDCAELVRARSESHLIATLARQLGYWPAFPFLNNLNNVIDMATKGLIGQPAGFAASTTEQVKAMLDVVLAALQNVAGRRTKATVGEVAQRAPGTERPLPARPVPPPPEQAQEGKWWHVSRLWQREQRQEDGASARAIAEEPENEKGAAQNEPTHEPGPESEHNGHEKTGENTEAVGALPIVVIKNFAAAGGQDEVMDVFARWAAVVTENQLAHVIVVSDNRENSKSIAKGALFGDSLRQAGLLLILVRSATVEASAHGPAL